MNESKLRDLLTNWPIQGPFEIHEMSSTHVAQIKTGSGDVYTLKDRGVREVARSTDLAFHAKVMDHLDENGVGVPALIKTNSGDLWVESGGHVFTLARFLHGGRWPEDPRLLPVLYRDIGRGIAEMHETLATYPTDGLTELTWRQDLVEELPDWLSQVEEYLPKGELTRITPWFRELMPLMLESMADLPEQLIHRDCHPGNTVVEGTKLVGFVDCDHFSIGPRILDLAYFAVHLIKWQVGNEDFTQRWLLDYPELFRGYHQVRPLTMLELDATVYVMMSIHVLFASGFFRRNMEEHVPTEIEALVWIRRNLESVKNAARAVL
jgi:Ser/Thr protein kinase RdoA (MazF antagonist)